MQSDNKYIFHKIIIVTILIWIGSWIFIDAGITKNDRGAFGDKFGFVNSLFSGLALGGIIYSIIMQRDELKLQRQELKESREEFEQLNFDNTFFNLLKTQQEITNNITGKFKYLSSLTKQKITEIEGREFFLRSRIELAWLYAVLRSKTYSKYDIEEYENLEIEMSFDNSYDYDFDKIMNTARLKFITTNYNISKQEWEKMKTQSEIEHGKNAYRYFFNKYHFTIGHYFRNLYHILKFLKSNETIEILKYSSEDFDEVKKIKEKYYQYAQFVQAQMSGLELALLFYNCLVFDKLYTLVKHYNILENCNEEDLLDRNHGSISGLKIKNRNLEINR